jgi:lysophospholipase L1-like esterase
MRYRIQTRRIVEGVSACIFVFFLLEGGSRIAWTFYNDFEALPSWYIYSTNFGWERNPNFSGTAYGAARKFDSRGFVSADTEQIIDNTSNPRIVFIGDSITFGNGVDTNDTFVELLDSEFPNMSAINLGVPGYTSYQGYKTLRDIGLDLNPSIIVVSFNFNDRRYVLHKAEIDSDQKFQREINKAVQFDQAFRNIYTYRLLRFAMAKTGLLQKPHKAEIYDLGRLHPRVSPENYRDNLVRMAEMSRERKIPMFFILFKDNPVDNEFLTTGVELLENSQIESAIRYLELAVELDNYFSDVARIYLSKAYEKINEREKAENILLINNILDSAHGGRPIYLDSGYNEIMKSVAKEYDITVIDAGHELDKYPVVYY